MAERRPARLRSFAASLALALRDSRANSAIEFSLAVPILIFLGVATFDYSAGTYRQMQVQEAAQLGAQYAVIHGFDASAISSAVQNSTAFASIAATPAPTTFCGCVQSGAVVTATCGDLCPSGRRAGTYVSVHSTAVYATTISYPSIPASFTLTGQAVVRLQ